MAALPDGYRSAEIKTGNRIHIAAPRSDRTLCGREVYALPDSDRWPPECPTCLKRLPTAGA